MSPPPSQSADNPKGPEMEQLGQEGSKAYLSCDYVTALAKWQRFLALAKESGDRRNEDRTLNNLGLIYVNLGQYDQAISDYTRTIEINPRNAMAYNNRGLSYAQKGQYDRAWEDVRKAQGLGYKVDPVFLEGLRKVSGRGKLIHLTKVT